MLSRERELYARCAEPKTEEIFHGILRWSNHIGLSDFDPKSPLVQTLGEHHAGFAGQLHGNFALFMTKQLAFVQPMESSELTNLKLLFPLSIGQITVARMYDRDEKFIGFRVYGSIEPYIK